MSWVPAGTRWNTKVVTRHQLCNHRGDQTTPCKIGTTVTPLTIEFNSLAYSESWTPFGPPTVPSGNCKLESSWAVTPFTKEFNSIVYSESWTPFGPPGLRFPSGNCKLVPPRPVTPLTNDHRIWLYGLIRTLDHLWTHSGTVNWNHPDLWPPWP